MLCLQLQSGDPEKVRRIVHYSQERGENLRTGATKHPRRHLGDAELGRPRSRLSSGPWAGERARSIGVFPGDATRFRDLTDALFEIAGSPQFFLSGERAKSRHANQRLANPRRHHPAAEPRD